MLRVTRFEYRNSDILRSSSLSYRIMYNYAFFDYEDDDEPEDRLYPKSNESVTRNPYHVTRNAYHLTHNAYLAPRNPSYPVRHGFLAAAVSSSLLR